MTDAGFSHRPVLLAETLDGLALREDGIYIDGTFGRGGHSAAILRQLGPQGRLLAMDKDHQAVAVASERFADEPRFEIVQGSFTHLAAEVLQRGWQGRVSGILLDLGVSSPQLDDPQRGFSFRSDGPLDMRMDTQHGPSAAEWLTLADAEEIAQVLKDYGEERHAKRIARAIVKVREEQGPIVSTLQLANVVAAANPSWEREKHPATRSFQAIRIFINGELTELQQVLTQSIEVLAPGGRLAVISFHSLEDRLVKRFIRDQARGGDFPPDLPIREEVLQRRLRPVGKDIRAANEELQANPRARSAVLRVAERLA